MGNIDAHILIDPEFSAWYDPNCATTEFRCFSLQQFSPYFKVSFEENGLNLTVTSNDATINALTTESVFDVANVYKYIFASFCADDIDIVVSDSSARFSFDVLPVYSRFYVTNIYNFSLSAICMVHNELEVLYLGDSGDYMIWDVHTWDNYLWH